MEGLGYVIGAILIYYFFFRRKKLTPEQIAEKEKKEV